MQAVLVDRGADTVRDPTARRRAKVALSNGQVISWPQGWWVLLLPLVLLMLTATPAATAAPTATAALTATAATVCCYCCPHCYHLLLLLLP